MKSKTTSAIPIIEFVFIKQIDNTKVHALLEHPLVRIENPRPKLGDLATIDTLLDRLEHVDSIELCIGVLT
ncbi:hypothetical protein [Pseudenhygromyxa sp. WMMC2535]|uniref:hypothetical protein n=1 Tax=Pseudenhygromyxa sp. WMMC2535 TaxID=2712867 RepID=UPI0023DE0DAB|nr:hypothetical protein [Pseudenhygromyxa sp. WMMC2535]